MISAETWAFSNGYTEKLLMDYANGITAFCSTELPHEFDLYKDDLDLSI